MARSQKPQAASNLLTLTPRRLAEWETGENGLVVVLAPKFSQGRVGRWLMRHIRRPYLRVKLDAYGSYVWKRCDGNTKVADIAADMAREFGGEIEPFYDRISNFLNQLEHGGVLKVLPPS